MGYERTCPMCGKIFYSGVDWGYKRGENCICSYSCLLKYDAKKHRVTKRLAETTGRTQRSHKYILYDTVEKKNVTVAEISENKNLSKTTIRVLLRDIDPGELLFNQYRLLNCLTEGL